MSNPNDKNTNDSEFSDDEFETMNLPEGEQSGKNEETADVEEFPEPAAGQTTPTDEESADEKSADAPADESDATVQLADSEPTDETMETVAAEEFPDMDSENVEATADLPSETPEPVQVEAQTISDTVISDADEPAANQNEATVIDPDLSAGGVVAEEFDAQTVEVNEQGEPASAESTFMNEDPDPKLGTLLDKPDTMMTINTRDLSPAEQEEFQRTIVDDEMASAESIADGIDPGSHTDLRDSGTVPTGEETGRALNTETQLVIQKRRFVEKKGSQVSAIAMADYELLETLGEGGMGVVYAANQKSIDRQVAIKMLKAKYVEKPKQRDNFLSEAVVTGDLDHPNIVPIYDLGFNDSNALFYSMKRVQGTPWRDILPEKTLAENIEILLKVADAVGFAHSRGVIHRDLKPENIMLGEFGEVLVMDWGLALTMPTFASKDNIAATASMGCTPAYAAPELVRGPRGKIGPHSDVYLLGAILYQLVTGEPPHRGNNVLQCLAAATGNKITPTEKTGELVDIAMKAMETEPQDRHEDAKAFQAAIRGYLSHSESLLLSEDAAKDLAKADQTQDYKDYQNAEFGFTKALEMWDGNVQATAGLRRARLAHARCAQGKGDFGLGLTLLDPADPEHAQLHTSLKAAKAEVDAREGRLKMARRIGVAMAASILVIVSVAAVWINSERQEAEKQKVIAEEQRDEADKQRAEAVKQEAIAVKQEKIAVANAKIAEEQRDEANKQRLEAVKQKGIAEENQQIAEKRRIEAEKARELEKEAKIEAIEAGKKEMIAKIAAQKAEKEARDAEKAALAAQKKEEEAKIAAVKAQKKEEVAKVAALKAEKEARDAEKAALAAKEKEEQAKIAAIDAQKKEKAAREQEAIARKAQEYESYVAQIGLAAERIAANNFKDAISILEKVKKDSPQHIDWEWHRLSYLTAPKQVPVNATAMVDAVAFRPDAKAFVAGGQGGTAFIWNAANPQERVPLQHGADVAAVAYSRDGQRVATGGNDGIVRIWDAESKPPKLITKLEGHTDRITDVVFAPDQTGQRVTDNDDSSVKVKQQLPANWIVSTSYDGTAILWDADKGEKLHTFLGHSYRVWAADFSPQGDLLVTVGEDRRAVVWTLVSVEYEENGIKKSLEPFEKRAEFSGHMVTNKRDGFPVRMPIYSVAFSHDGTRVATGGDDGFVRIWNPLEVEEPNISDIIKSLADGNSEAIRSQPVTVKGQMNELKGHSAAVHAVSFSRDDRQVLSGSDDNTMRIWNSETGEVVKILRGHAGWVRACAFAPAGDVQQVLSGSHDGEARLWNVDTYTEKLQMVQSESDEPQRPEPTVINHDDAVFAAAFDPKSNLIVTAGRNQRASIWNAKTGKLVRLLGRENAADEQANALQEGHAFLATTVVPFDGGRRILTSALDNTARIWDAHRGVELARLDNTGTTAAAAVSPDGTLIATGSNVQYKDATDATGTKLKYRTYPVRIWRTATAVSAEAAAKPELELEGHRERVTAIAFSPDGEFIFSGDNYGKVILWRVADGKQIGDYRGPNRTVNAVKFSDDGRQMFAASDDQIVHIWNRTAEKEMLKEAIYPERELALDGDKGHKGSVVSMALVPGKPLLLTSTGGDDRMVRLWDLESGKVVKTFDEIQSRKANDAKRPLVTGLSVSPDGLHAFAANSDANVIHVIDINARQVVASRAGLGAIWSTAVYHTSLAGGQQPALRLATVGGDDTRVWAVNAQNNLKNVQLEATLAPHDAVTAADFSTDGQFVITGGGDSALKMWRTKDGKDVFKFPAENGDGKPYHTKGITHVSFARAGDPNQLVTASNDGAVILWKWDPKVQTASVVRMFSGHTEGVNCAVFSDDGQFVLTASSDGTARIWDVTKPESIVTLEGHDRPVRCGAFAPDGTWVVTGGDDDAARIWSVATGQEIKAPLTGHTGSITSVDVSPRGTRIITGSLDQTAKLWDPRVTAADAKDAKEDDADEPGDKRKEAREILTLGGRPDHTGGITSVSFSADGLTGPIVTGSLDGTAILWLADDAPEKHQQVAGN